MLYRSFILVNVKLFTLLLQSYSLFIGYILEKFESECLNYNEERNIEYSYERAYESRTANFYKKKNKQYSFFRDCRFKILSFLKFSFF